MAKAPSVLEQIKNLDAQRSKLLPDAKAEAMSAANNAINELNALGFQYRLVEGAARATPTSDGTRKGTRTVKNEPCPICKFLTSPPHDKRSHRTQEPKKPFTDAELAAKGMTKVS